MGLWPAGTSRPVPRAEINFTLMRFAVVALALLATCRASAQTDTTAADTVIRFVNPESPPQFPGGHQALEEFIETNMVRPQASVAGKVWVQFVVETDGSLHDIVVVRGVNAELDNEALRLVRSFPSWIPGSVFGTPGRMVFQQAIDFSDQY